MALDDIQSSQSESSKTKKNTLLKIGGIILILVVLLLVVRSVISSRNQQRAMSTQKSNVAATPLATQQVGKSIQIKLNKNAKDSPTITYELQDAQLLKEIVVKGQTAQAAPGRAFFIIDLKITNGTKQGIQLNTRDYVRLATTAKPDEWVAPDIHNDPVEVQAISTKLTRIGFPVDDTTKNVKLQIGEIDGEKTYVDVNL